MILRTFLLLILGAAFLGGQRGSAANDPTPRKDPAALSAELRLMALNMQSGAIKGANPATAHGAWGSVTDISLQHGGATVMYFIDGSSSVYRSAGGGIIGGQGHENVHRMGSSVLACLEQSFSSLHAGSPVPMPAAGHVRFYVHARDGLLQSDEISVDELVAGHHPLSACYIGVQKLLTTLRELTPAGAAKPPA
jgi:hypothetical protein